MKYIKDTLDFKIEEPSVITLGKFDGLHSGHRYLMEAMQKGKEQGLKCVIFTFDFRRSGSGLSDRMPVYR